jgi:Uma2 family endonuclease
MTPITPMAEGGATNTANDPYFYGWRYVEKKRDDGTVFSERVPLTEWDVLHPQEDDFIMITEPHERICGYLADVIRDHLANHPGAHVLVDHRVDWQVPGIEPHGPDLTVLFDSPPWGRTQEGTYFVRDMGAKPVCVIEVTSPSTRSVDLGDKVREYCAVGIPLYVIVDVVTEGDELDIRLLAFRPSPSGSEQIALPDETRVWIPQVDLWIALGRDSIVCLDKKLKEIGDFSEQRRKAEMEEREKKAALRLAKKEQNLKEAALEQAEDEKREKETALKQAEDEKQQKEAALKQAEDEKQQKEAALKQAEDEKQQKEAALKQAEDEKREKETALRRIQEMEAEICRLKRDPS